MLGILSVVCLGVFAGIPAIICGHSARSKIQREPGRFSGAGMALAGLILGYVSVAIAVMLLFLVVLVLVSPQGSSLSPFIYSLL